MELKIGFECTECKKIFPLDFNDLIPADKRACEECNQTVMLTDLTLKDFASDLRQYCERCP